MLKFNSILLFSKDPQKLADFYQQIFQTQPTQVADGYFAFKTGDMLFTIGPHDQVHGPNGQPERILFDFETDDVAGEFTRIKALASVVKEPYHPGEDPSLEIATFADPDGNYFQLMSPITLMSQ